jgi:hypothetical protein
VYVFCLFTKNNRCVWFDIMLPIQPLDDFRVFGWVSLISGENQGGLALKSSVLARLNFELLYAHTSHSGREPASDFASGGRYFY